MILYMDTELICKCLVLFLGTTQVHHHITLNHRPLVT